MKLYQIPFSHNCVKVRKALEKKDLDFECVDIEPTDRKEVFEVSGQGLVPVLIDGEEVISDSTAILQYLEENYDDESLLPEEEEKIDLCWLLEDWADQAFMAMTRRMGYWQVINTPGQLEELFFPEAGKIKSWFLGKMAKKLVVKRFGLSEKQNKRDEKEARRLAALAVSYLDSRDYLLGDQLTVADIALATMAAPLWGSAEEVKEDENVKKLLHWLEPILGEDDEALNFYKGEGD